MNLCLLVKPHIQAKCTCFVTEITLPFAFKSSDKCLSLGDAESKRKTDTRRNRVEIEKEIVCRCSDRWIIRVTLQLSVSTGKERPASFPLAPETYSVRNQLSGFLSTMCPQCQVLWLYPRPQKYQTAELKSNLMRVRDCASSTGEWNYEGQRAYLPDSHLCFVQQSASLQLQQTI